MITNINDSLWVTAADDDLFAVGFVVLFFPTLEHAVHLKVFLKHMQVCIIYNDCGFICYISFHCRMMEKDLFP